MGNERANKGALPIFLASLLAFGLTNADEKVKEKTSEERMLAPLPEDKVNPAHQAVAPQRRHRTPIAEGAARCGAPQILVPNGFGSPEQNSIALDRGLP